SGPVSDPLVRSFLRSTRWAPSTRRVTAWVLHNFSVWAEQRGIKLCDISRDDVEGYLTERAALGLAPATLRGDWRALRGLYRWLAEEGELDRDPTRRIP